MKSFRMYWLMLLLPLVGLCVGGCGDSNSLESVQQKAEAGDAPAQYNLGYMYANGRGVPKDDREAVKWYRKAAEQGDAGAQYNLGGMYAKGEGVPQDYILAYAWFNLADLSGGDGAKISLNKLERKMTPEQISKAQELSKTLVIKPDGNAKP
jgi:TPR repeat protein